MEQRKCQLPSCHEKLFYDDKPVFPHNKKSAKDKAGRSPNSICTDTSTSN